MTFSSFNRARAFTLIELLVVIAIIAILAALIFGVARSVQTRANTAKSLSNLRQIGVASHSYATDHDNVLPSSEQGQPSWIEILWPYVEGERPFPGFTASDRAEKLADTVFYTPNVEKSTSGRTPRAFGWNYILKTYTPANRAISFDQPSKVGLVADSTYSSSLSSAQINFRNNGRANVLFMDGHASSVLPEAVPDTNVGIFWRGFNPTP